MSNHLSYWRRQRAIQTAGIIFAIAAFLGLLGGVFYSMIGLRSSYVLDRCVINQQKLTAYAQAFQPNQQQLLIPMDLSNPELSAVMIELKCPNGSSYHTDEKKIVVCPTHGSLSGKPPKAPILRQAAQLVGMEAAPPAAPTAVPGKLLQQIKMPKVAPKKAVKEKPVYAYLLNPADGSTVSGMQPIDIELDGLADISSVTFYINGQARAQTRSFPHVFNWQSGQEKPGKYRIEAMVSLTNGKSLRTDSATVTVTR